MLDPATGRITLSDAHPIMEKRKNNGGGVVSEDLYDYHFGAFPFDL